MCFSSTHLESTRHKEKCTFLNFFAGSALKRVSHSIWEFENLLIKYILWELHVVWQWQHEIWPVSKALWRKPHVTSNVLSANAAWAQFDNHGCALQSLLEVEPPGKAAPAQRCWVCQDKWPGPGPPPSPSSTHMGQPALRWGFTSVLVFLLQHQIWSIRQIDRKTTMIGQTEPSCCKY